MIHATNYTNKCKYTIECNVWYRKWSETKRISKYRYNQSSIIIILVLASYNTCTGEVVRRNRNNKQRAVEPTVETTALVEPQVLGDKSSTYTACLFLLFLLLFIL